MNFQDKRFILPLVTITLLLSGCGGSTSDLASASSFQNIPPPVSTPAPLPPPPAPPPPPPPFVAEKASIFSQPLLTTTLAVAGKGWALDQTDNANHADGSGISNIRDADGFEANYDPVAQSYTITLPNSGTGILFQTTQIRNWSEEFGTTFGGTIARDAASAQGNTELEILKPEVAGAKYRYVSFANWLAGARIDNSSSTLSYGVYGIAQPTPAGNVPVSGTARYDGHISGYMAGNAADFLSGTARFDFDFSSAQVTGNMAVSLSCFMGCSYSSTNYTFEDTVFGVGSTSFSGRLISEGIPSAGYFSGLFAGPEASELMASFKMPFFNQDQNRWVQAGGVVLAKKN